MAVAFLANAPLATTPHVSQTPVSLRGTDAAIPQVNSMDEPLDSVNASHQISGKACLAAAASIAAAAGCLWKKGSRRTRRRRSCALQAEGGDGASRATLLRGGAAVVAAVSSSPMPAGAVTFDKPTTPGYSSFEDAQKALKSWKIDKVAGAGVKQLPDFGKWKTLVEPFGYTKASQDSKYNLGDEPMIATFIVPDAWITTGQNLDPNGIAGTISGNDYQKGDTATLFVATNFKGEGDPMKATVKKTTWKPLEDLLISALSQKGGAMLEDFRIVKVTDSKEAPGYKIAEYEWDIKSGNGSLVPRRGVASVTKVGTKGYYQCLWTGAVLSRYNTMIDYMDKMAASFRVAPVTRQQMVENGVIKEAVEDAELLALENEAPAVYLANKKVYKVA